MDFATKMNLALINAGIRKKGHGFVKARPANRRPVKGKGRPRPTIPYISTGRPGRGKGQPKPRPTFRPGRVRPGSHGRPNPKAGVGGALYGSTALLKPRARNPKGTIIVRPVPRRQLK
jgi:hypothetical protein